MKKYVISILLVCGMLMTITGCGEKKENDTNKDNNKNYSKMTCTNNTDAIADSITVDIEYEDNYIKNVKYTYNIKDSGETVAKLMQEEFKKDFEKVTGVEENYSDKKWIQTYNFEKINLDEYKTARTNYLNYLSNSTTKDFTYIKDNHILLDSYKNIELSGYTCK